MPLDEAYFVWLYSQVGSVKNRNRAKTYWTLLRILYTKEFTWSRRIDKDENRAHDGKDLRLEFLRERAVVVDDPGWMDVDCSMLEMMIALAWKLAFEGGGKQSDWFWHLVDNLNLLSYTDANPPDEAVINHTLNVFINRAYDPSGSGGLFPLKFPESDQRDVEIWYQAQAYLLERL